MNQVNSTQQSSQQPREAGAIVHFTDEESKTQVRLDSITFPRMHGLEGAGPGSESSIVVCAQQPIRGASRLKTSQLTVCLCPSECPYPELTSAQLSNTPGEAAS